MIYLIRHGESTSNVGERTVNPSSIPLTNRGVEQAKELAENIVTRPDLIVVSPFLRTQQTAAPLIKKYPDVPVEIWDIQEFTCLDANLCNNTTPQERAHILQEYKDKNDSNLVHGVGAESFNQLFDRVDNMLNRLKKINKDKFVVIFTHGHFIEAVKVRLDNSSIDLKSFFLRKGLDNCEIFELNLGE